MIDTGAVEEFQQVLRDCAPEQSAQGYRLANAQAGFLESTLRERGDGRPRHPAPGANAPSGRPRRRRPNVRVGELGRRAAPLPEARRCVVVVPPPTRLRRDPGGRDGAGKDAPNAGIGRELSWRSANGQSDGSDGQRWVRSGWVRRCPNRPGLDAAPSGAATSLRPWPEGLGQPLPSLWSAPRASSLIGSPRRRSSCPHLRVLPLQGPDRQARFAEIAQSDLVVTSYALVRRDAERYRGIEFDTVVLDEAQHIKNRETQNAQAVKAIRCHHRLVLTGTPLENSVLDLWSIFDFLMPGYLGGAQEFRERYEVPITRDRDPEVQTRLARRVRPFLLRRLKREVTPDLPAKIEQVALCDLTPEQAAVYRQLLEAGRREVLDAVACRASCGVE